MNQIEEFNNYYINQLNETDNQIYYEDSKYEDIIEEKEKDIIDGEKVINNSGKIKIKESSIKRINSLPKRYQTYTLEYKKEVIAQVNQ